MWLIENIFCDALLNHSKHEKIEGDSSLAAKCTGGLWLISTGGILVARPSLSFWLLPEQYIFTGIFFAIQRNLVDSGLYFHREIC